MKRKSIDNQQRRAYQQSPPIGFEAVKSQAGPARKKKKKRSAVSWRRLIFMLFAGACSMGLGAALGSTPLLYVRSTDIAGARQLTHHELGEISHLAQLPPRTNLLKAPFRRIAQSIKKLPYVRDARVMPTLPPGVKIDITPRIPRAVLQTPLRSVELDSEGLAIRTARPHSGLPVITTSAFMDPRPGAGVSDSGIEGALEIVRETGTKLASRTYGILVDASAELCLNMDDGLTIRLGQPEELRAKLELIRRVYTEAPGIAKDLETIDLRAPEAPACTPRSAKKPALRTADTRRN